MQGRYLTKASRIKDSLEYNTVWIFRSYFFLAEIIGYFGNIY